MRKLSHQEAAKLVETAHKEVHERPCLRFGQALYNILPKCIATEINGGPLDFFYKEDKEEVLLMFYSNLVDGVSVEYGEII